MGINTYTGLMGSGKSYEVVSEVILTGIAQGRRVVTNVDGIDNDLIRDYVHEKQNIPYEKLGNVIHCENQDVFLPDFFPHYDDLKNVVVDTLVHPGDLVCIDEAWRFWGTEQKILKPHRSFFLEHRHFVHPVTNIACDLVLMIQDIGTLHRSIKSVVAFSFRTHKKISLGMPTTYSVNMWEGSKMTKATLIGSFVRKYKKEIFPLYSSFKGGVQGKIVNTDKRQNIFNNPKLLIMIGSAVLFMVLSAYWLVHYVQKTTSTTKIKTDSVKTDTAPTVKSDSLQTNIKPSDEMVFSSEWRIVGTVVSETGTYQVLKNNNGDLRFSSFVNFGGSGYGRAGVIDGKTITHFSGSTSHSTIAPIP